MKSVLDLITKALTTGRLAVSTMLLLVDIACATTLYHRKLQSFREVVSETYACVELILRFTRRKLRDNIDRTTGTIDDLRSKTR
jgi:hypothetical protein